MKKRIFPRIYYSVCCSAFLLSVVVLIGSTFVLAHTPDTNTIDAAAAAQWQAGGAQVQLEGQLEIVHQDFQDGHGQFVYTLKQADGTRVPLHFVKHPPTHLLTGDHVRANGQLSGGGLILYSGSTNLTKTTTTANGKTQPPPPPPTSSIPVPNTFGSQSVLVILVNFQDDAVQPYTLADAQNMYFGTANNFVMESSYQQTSLNGTVVGWYTIPESVTTCNATQIATDAENAATAAGVNLSNYTRYVYAFPYDTACGGWAGMSTVGGNPSQSWINWNSPGIQLIDHELGHAFGLWHSHALDCGTTTVCSNGTVDEYGDNIDTMGYPQGPSPHYNSFQKERLGWLNYGASPSIQTVTGSGTYNIYPYEIAGPGPNALKVLQSTNSTTGARTWYYLESRQAVGFDSFLTDGTCSACYTQNETTGVLFHLGTDGDGNSSLVLSMTPANPAPGWYDDSLTVGQTFQDSTAGVTFAPTSVSGTGATVQITMNGSGSACTAANPAVSVSPSQSQNVTSWTAVNFTATVTDKDSSGCSAATFNLAAALPSGWAGVWSAAALSLSPGKSGSATLTVTSPTGTADGSYNVGVSAINASAGSYSGSTAAAYVINTAPLSVSLTTNQSSYLPGQTVAIYATLVYGTVPDVGASVTVTVTAPNGRKTTLSGITSSNGVATLAYNLSKHASAGTYQAQYGTTVSGAAPILGASTSFTVQ
jgi:M6 family metalloprotease-like protein